MPPDTQTLSQTVIPPPPLPPEALADLARLRDDLASLPAESDAASAELLARMRAGLRAGRERIRERFEASDGSAEAVHRELTRQMDFLIQGALDFAERRLYGTSNPTTGEHLAVVAVGGYGRGELAPGSDVDLLFLCPYKRTPLIEQLAEFLLYKLWDLGLKVGQAVRSVPECVKLAKGDLTVRTALLESRLVWGSEHLYEELVRAYEKEIVAGHGPDFVEAKLAERDQRHQRLGDSRFLLEPNVKEGKGGLRDLHTLLWIGKFLYRVREPGELVQHGVLDRPSLVVLLRARRVLWAVRCHLHYLTGRAEERLTFDLQPEIARRMGSRDRQQGRAVERFMKRYYLAARDVGALTRIVCAALEDKHQRRPRLALPRFGLGRRRVNGFSVQGDRVGLDDPALFEREPAKMLELFHLAQERELDIRPQAMTALAQTLRRIGSRRLRDDPDSSRLFL
ncbi:MAG TPA: nucleotidyltransferase domain-containing protein, partial [Geminicoccaceae bacterium]